MGTFEVVRTARAHRSRVFAVVSDFGSHGEFIPLTRMETDAGSPGPGWRFVGRSGLGPLALVDRMEVTVWEPDRHFRVDKRGPALDGWAEVHLSEDGPFTRLVWREEIVPRPAVLGSRLGPLLDPVNRWMFGRALDRMVRRAEQG
ncbi:SRPBCC family protein [Ornithinimicrobium sediminis]|uniref:SRPBCC family protein n=1 Tax=Ornithinimicrobium sediminis TaxID=2904603 RepID=UPI001E65B90F|nr:SRPBCC family protein [Ornithinimicrobium sediminis]MCE0486292.1 SRPBCC family protein [Ornithinimicrobium sediminis]